MALETAHSVEVVEGLPAFDPTVLAVHSPQPRRQPVV